MSEFDPHLLGVAQLVYALGIDVYDTEVSRPPYNPRDWEDAAWDESTWVEAVPRVILTMEIPKSHVQTLSRAGADVLAYPRVSVWAGTAQSAREWGRRVTNVLDGARPVVDEFSTFLERTTPGAVWPDTDVSPALLGFTDTYRYRATAA